MKIEISTLNLRYAFHFGRDMPQADRRHIGRLQRLVIDLVLEHQQFCTSVLQDSINCHSGKNIIKMSKSDKRVTKSDKK